MSTGGHMTAQPRRVGRTCSARKHRELVPENGHHVHPLEYGGPNEPDNIVQLCMNCHGLVHELLRAMLKARTTEVPWTFRRQFGPGVRAIATHGFHAIAANPEHLERISRHLSEEDQ